MEDFESYKEVTKKVKILKGETQEEVYGKLERFERDHSILETKQYSPTMMFVFYTE